MKYTVHIPFINDMGTLPPFIVSDKTMETKEQELLWNINKMREHDGLKPLSLAQLEDIIWLENVKFTPITEE